MIETASRAETLGRYIVKNRSTVRAAAKAFGISKSTVHTDVTVKLKYLNGKLWCEVRSVLDENKAERHIRGGQATRDKYLKIKNI